MPKRLRRKNYREPLPPGSKLVARPSRFGNPYTIDEYGRAEAIRLYIVLREHDTVFRARVRTELGGYDVVCYCPLEEACHGDVLLRWANDPEG